MYIHHIHTLERVYWSYYSLLAEAHEDLYMHQSESCIITSSLHHCFCTYNFIYLLLYMCVQALRMSLMVEKPYTLPWNISMVTIGAAWCCGCAMTGRTGGVWRKYMRLTDSGPRLVLEWQTVGPAVVFDVAFRVVTLSFITLPSWTICYRHWNVPWTLS